MRATLYMQADAPPPVDLEAAAPIVLHVIASAGRYGAEAVVAALAREQSTLGMRVHVMIISDRLAATAAYAEELELDAHAHVTVIPGRGIRDFFVADELGRLVRSRRVNIIHSHGYKSDIVISRMRISGPVKVSTLHGWTNVRSWSKMAAYQALQVRALHRFDAVVAVHDSVWSQHPGLATLTPKHTVPNGIGRAHEPAATGGFAWLPANEVPVVLVVGRLSKEKGQTVALHAMDLLTRRGVAATLVLAGAGPDLDVLRQQAALLGLNDRVLFPGYVDAIPALMKRATLLLIPSYTEGLPIILLEAMRDRVAIVATAVGGMPAVLGYGRAGRLVAPGAAIQMAEAIEALLSHPEERAGMVDTAYRQFLERYNAQAMARGYARVYESVAGRSLELRTAEAGR